MITVTISINGEPIFTRSACRVNEINPNCFEYRVDTGEHILHDPKDGAVGLSHKLLETITETK